jgi:DNA-binding NarL/FixJ family response regulator
MAEVLVGRDAELQLLETLLGALPWAERARQELTAAGERSLPRATGALDLLSPQELLIAQLAADGLSNREIGQKLYLSHRTVGSHLYRIFPKLGIASRAELAAAVTPARATTPAPELGAVMQLQPVPASDD